MTKLTPDDTLNTVESLLTDADNALDKAQELLLRQLESEERVPVYWRLYVDIRTAGSAVLDALYSWKAAYRQVSTQ